MSVKNSRVFSHPLHVKRILNWIYVLADQRSNACGKTVRGRLIPVAITKIILNDEWRADQWDYVSRKTLRRDLLSIYKWKNPGVPQWRLVNIYNYNNNQEVVNIVILCRSYILLQLCVFTEGKNSSQRIVFKLHQKGRPNIMSISHI